MPTRAYDTCACGNRKQAVSKVCRECRIKTHDRLSTDSPQDEWDAAQDKVRREYLNAARKAVERAEVAEAEVQRLGERERLARLWFETEPWKGDPDPGSFGGRPYTEHELALGYGTYRDPRFLPALLAASPPSVPAGEPDGGGAK